MRPKGLTAICIIGLILSVLGFISNAVGMFWWFMGERFAEMMTGLTPGMNQQAADLQRTMYQEMSQMQARWAPVTIALTILQMVLAVLLFVAAVRGLKMSRGALKLLATTMVFAILLQLGRIYPDVMIQEETQEISMRYTARVMQTTGNPAQTRAVMNMTRQFQKIGASIGYLFMAAWTIAKLSYYGTGLWYVNRKDVKALFAPEESPPPVEIEVVGPPAEPVDGS
jgi:hypothetical protein